MAPGTPKSARDSENGRLIRIHAEFGHHFGSPLDRLRQLSEGRFGGVRFLKNIARSNVVVARPKRRTESWGGGFLMHQFRAVAYI